MEGRGLIPQVTFTDRETKLPVVGDIIDSFYIPDNQEHLIIHHVVRINRMDTTKYDELLAIVNNKDITDLTYRVSG